VCTFITYGLLVAFAKNGMPIPILPASKFDGSMTEQRFFADVNHLHMFFDFVDYLMKKYFNK